jgi:hypothetical protein
LYRRARFALHYRGRAIRVSLAEDQACLGPGTATVSDGTGKYITAIYPSVSVDAPISVVSSMVEHWLNGDRDAQLRLGLFPVVAVTLAEPLRRTNRP